MKITTYFSVAAMIAMLAANTSCTKEEAIAPEENKHIVTLNVSTETLSRISLTDETDGVKVAWEADDELEVWARPAAVGTGGYGGVGKAMSIFNIQTIQDSKNATFTGELTEKPDYLYVVYRKNTNENDLKIKGSDLSFQVSAYPQTLTDQLNNAPMILAGVFKKQSDETYSPVGKMLYGGALFEITIQGLTPSAKITGMKYMYESSAPKKWLCGGANFGFDGTDFTYLGGAGVTQNATSELLLNGDVATDASGSVTIYSLIVPQGKDGNLDDYAVYVQYDGDVTYTKVGVIKFLGKKLYPGTCHKVTLVASQQ